MSSATQYNPDAARGIINGSSTSLINGRVARLGMSPRQQELNRLYAHYRCQQYAACKLDWDGLQVDDPIDHEAIATAGFIPAGFVDAGSTMPIKFRKPTAPYNLNKAVVDRFTGLLFSERHHPAFRVEGGPDTEAYAAALAQASRLWSEMIKVRTFGGATGVAVVGFKFIQGKPRIEVHDPRWVFPTFKDREALKLASVEIRYMFPEEERDPETGAWVPIWYWYRRTIDEKADTVFAKEPVGNGDEPQWVEDQVVEHGLDVCPVVWTQNLPVQGDVDGDPDCHGVLDQIDAFDRLQAQAIRGTIRNCDPTVVVTTNSPLAAINKGSDNAIKLPVGGDAKYMEMVGTSVKTAMELCQTIRTQILEVAQCVLEHPDVATPTATEVTRKYEAMYAKADVLREQYGERCVKPLLEMMIEAAKKLGTAKVEGDKIVRRAVVLPPRIVDGRPVPVKLPEGEDAPIELKWPAYEAPSTKEAADASTAAVAAFQGGLIDQQHASSYVAPHFNVEDVPSMVKNLQIAADKKQRLLAQQISDGMPAVDDGGGGGFGGSDGQQGGDDA